MANRDPTIAPPPDPKIFKPKFRERILNFSRHLRSSKSAGFLALLGLVGASSCARMLGLDDLEFIGPKGTQGGTGGEGQSSGVAGEQIGGSAGRNTGGATGSNAGQGTCGTCAGDCLEGVCCPKGYFNCGGECFDLFSSAAHCGSCETTCEAEQVCNEGRCSSDCEKLARCGNDCVDLASNLNHCQHCNTRCFSPLMNGKAVCAAEGCVIECNPDSEPCGNSCCPPPPENGNVVCNSAVQCQVECDVNYHACVETEDPSCYRDDDDQHCGASCYDCWQPNATVRCIDSHCANTCDGPVTFPCDDAPSKVACGIWDFESGTPEGWFVDLDGLTNAWTDTLEATQAKARSGTYSLAFGFEGDDSRDPNARYIIELGVSVCSDGVNWPSHQFAFHYFFETAPDSDPPPHGKAEVYLQLRNGDRAVYAGCDSLQPNARGEWGVMTCDLIDIPEFTRMSLVFRIFHAPWTGTIYLDRVGWRDRE
jgi:hypothetical protein